MNRLNDEQRKMVEENYDIIHTYMEANNLSNNMVDDWHGMLCIAMCNAALTYDPTKGASFRTYAYTAIRLKHASEKFKYASRINKVLIVGLGAKKDSSFNLDDNDTFVLNSTRFAVYDKPIEISIDLNKAYKEALHSMNAKYIPIIEYYFNDKVTMTETAKKFGVSKQRISTIIKVFTQRLKFIYGKEN